ncbi:MAG: hypothetical protein QCI82_04530 [Candidatus Thermoplasmatota archaeon]|nr:hypothetical protein [Candidatus Thermoplasmatota archaeon]
MTLERYSPDILRMIYHLATMRRKLFGKELEEYLSIRLGGTSPRTIHRWLRFTKGLEPGERTFDYYPQINPSSFGLIRCEVLFRHPKDVNILGAIPHLYWAGIVRDSAFDEYLVAHYLIPSGRIDGLHRVLEAMSELGMFSGYDACVLRSGLFIPSPFFDMIGRDGRVRLDGNIDNSAFVNAQTVNEGQGNMLDEIRRRPILVPLIFESDKESPPYQQIWSEIGNRLGGRLGSYFRGPKDSIPLDEEHGAAFVRRAFNEINRSFDLYYENMRVYYKPLYDIPGLVMANISLSFDSENTREMLEVITRISERCIYTTSYFTDGNGARLGLLTSFEQLFIVLKWLKHTGIDFRHFFIDRPKSWALWGRRYSKLAYWELFDPETASWSFDTEGLIRRLEGAG